MPRHKWHLVVSDTARRQIKELPSTKDRMAVFRSIAEILQAENPKSLQGVKKLESKKFGDQW